MTYEPADKSEIRVIDDPEKWFYHNNLHRRGLSSMVLIFDIFNKLDKAYYKDMPEELTSASHMGQFLIEQNKAVSGKPGYSLLEIYPELYKE